MSQTVVLAAEKAFVARNLTYQQAEKVAEKGRELLSDRSFYVSSSSENETRWDVYYRIHSDVDVFMEDPEKYMIEV